MTTLPKFLYTALLALSLQGAMHASSLLVSYSTAGGGGGVDLFSLAPLTPGQTFDTENVPVTSLTVAGSSAYWATATQIYSESLAGGAAKTPLPSVPFGGVTITDLAVDPVSNSYLVGWNAPGYGWFIAKYPLNPVGTYDVFVNGTTNIQGLTIVGNQAYWIEGQNIWQQNLDGTGKTLLQSYTAGPVTLQDVAIDIASQSYLLAATTSGIPPLIAKYPLVQNATGAIFNFATANTPAVTVAGGKAYWIDGQDVWSENLNGTGLVLQETLPAGSTPTDLAVTLIDPVPEPGSLILMACGCLLVAMLRRRRATPPTAG